MTEASALPRSHASWLPGRFLSGQTRCLPYFSIRPLTVTICSRVRSRGRRGAEPALTSRISAGDLDKLGTARYAQRVGSTWVDRFILSSTTARGYLMTEQDRSSQLDTPLTRSELPRRAKD